MSADQHTWKEVGTERRPLTASRGATVSRATAGPAARWWRRLYVVQLLLCDILAVDLGGFLLPVLGLQPVDHSWRDPASTLAVGALLVFAWLFSLHAAGAYELRHLGVGAVEFLRVTRAAGYFAGGVAVVCLVLGIDAPRHAFVVDLPIVLLLALLMRWAGRRRVQAIRRRGGWSERILIAGSATAVCEIIAATGDVPESGLRVVGACVDGLPIGSELIRGVPVLGEVADAVAAAAVVDADVVALAGHRLGSQDVRALGWALAGTRRQLIMAPELTGVAGPRVDVQHVEGLPLMWVDQPQFTGAARAIKRTLDVVGAAVLLLVTAPLLLLAAVAIKIDSPGPVFFRQWRLGKDGRLFRMVKLRTMVVDAEERKQGLLHLNEVADAEHRYFKLRVDPRITRVGRVLRRMSIDELPQLLNVLGGEMSLVGPRPLTGDPGAQGETEFRRRLVVKPGLTGLWQVSGRSDLSVDQAVRLDLYYVENWSLILDLMIIFRTLWVIVRSRGAY